jgi:hypothetical protein
MVGCKKLLIVLVILLMLFGTAWSLETKDQARKGLSDDSSLKKRLRDNQAFIWNLGQSYQNGKTR